MYIFKPSLIKTITLALVSFALAPSPGWTQPIQPISQPDNERLPLLSLTAAKHEEPDFSGAGRPGRQTSGESRSNCPTVALPLIPFFISRGRSSLDRIRISDSDLCHSQ